MQNCSCNRNLEGLEYNETSICLLCKKIICDSCWIETEYDGMLGNLCCSECETKLETLTSMSEELINKYSIVVESVAQASIEFDNKCEDLNYFDTEFTDIYENITYIYSSITGKEYAYKDLDIEYYTLLEKLFDIYADESID